MAGADNPPQSGGGGKKKYFLAKNSPIDELIVGEKGSIFKEDQAADPLEMSEDEVKQAKDMGAKLTEAKS
jgi:hypothetical protein